MGVKEESFDSRMVLVLGCRKATFSQRAVSGESPLAARRATDRAVSRDVPKIDNLHFVFSVHTARLTARLTARRRTETLSKSKTVRL